MKRINLHQDMFAIISKDYCTMVKVLKIRYTLGNRYLVDICWLSEAFLRVRI